MEHATLNPKTDHHYWDFSYDELAIYDLPAYVDYIKAQVGVPQVIYMGHSQGTFTWMLKVLHEPAWQNNFKAFFGLCQVFFIQDIVKNKL